MRAGHRTGRLKAFTALLCAAVLTVMTGCEASGQKGVSQTGYSDFADIWFYDTFDDGQKAAYNAFMQAAADPFAQEQVPISGTKGESIEIPVEDLNTIYQGFLYDHPEVFWLSQSYTYKVSAGSGMGELAQAVGVIPIADSPKALEAQKKEFEAAAVVLLKETESASDDKQKAIILYDLLADRTEYKEEALYDDNYKCEHTAYGAVVSQSAVCDGLALAYKYLLNRCGIRCIAIPGTSDSMPHVWNTVFWDGSWHEADLTWDIESSESDRRQYFDLTTLEMNKDHIREEDGIAPAVPLAE